MSVKSQNAKKFVCYFTNYDLFYRAPLSSVRQNIIATIIIVWYCCHHYFIMSSLMDTDVLDLLVQDKDLEELLLSSSCPFVFHSGMNCPVVSCGFSSFKTKSYSRHSETRQNPHHIIIYCSIPRCKSTCRRKTDMQYHLRSIHHLNQLSIIVALNWTILYDIFFSTKHVLHSIIILNFFSEWLTSHRLSKCAAFDRANCVAMQQLAKKGISSW